MRAYCNKKEDNFITYHQNREKEIERTREWEKLNPEKRKEYTIKYYKTEKGHRKRLAQQKRYREKKKLIKENEKLKKQNELLLEENKRLFNSRFTTELRQCKSVLNEIREIIKIEKEKMGYAIYDSCLLLIEEKLDKVKE